VGAAIAAIAEQATRRALEKNISETEVLGMCFGQRNRCWGWKLSEETRADLYTHDFKSLEHNDLRANLVAGQPKLKAWSHTSLGVVKEMTRANALRAS
jgi:hypothetical protein